MSVDTGADSGDLEGKELIWECQWGPTISTETSPDKNSFLLYVQNHHEFLLASRTQKFKSVRNMLTDPGCGGTHFYSQYSGERGK